MINLPNPFDSDADHPLAPDEAAYGVGPCMRDLPALQADNERERQKLAEPSMTMEVRTETPAATAEHDAAGDFDELLARLNALHKHPCDLDALRANKEKIDQNSYPEDREQLKFLRGIEPIYYPVARSHQSFIRSLFAGR